MSSFRAELNSLNSAKLADIGFESYDSMEGLIAIDRSAPPARFGSWPGAKLIDAVYPGLLVAGTIALASTWLAQHYTAPVMLFALLFGMAFHFLHEEGRCVAGIEFASRSVLRLGVGLLGVRITLSQIASLGPWPVATVIVGVATTILLGFLLARRLGLSSMFGVLSGGAVAIGGASHRLRPATQRHTGARHHSHRCQRHRTLDNRDDHLPDLRHLDWPRPQTGGHLYRRHDP
jgi:hypothetical protein